MARWAEYEEKEFETLANAEFTLNSRATTKGLRLFSPGQVLEKSLGFDFSTRIAPSSMLHRMLFGRFPGATGMPTSVAANLRIPKTATTHMLNFFVQYKRPEHFTPGHRSPLWPTDEEFLRFKVAERLPAPISAWDFSQLKSLVKLTSVLAGSALVRYACPSVATKDALYGRFHSGNLLDSSVFVDPRSLEDATIPGGFHKFWTFQPSNLDFGIPNPGGPKSHSISGEKLFRHLATEIESPSGPEDYVTDLVRMADRLESEAPNLRPERAGAASVRSAELQHRAQILHELTHFEAGGIHALAAATQISIVASDLGLQWMIIAVDR